MEKMSLPQLILEDTENFVAIAPYASRFPGESLIYTKRSISSIMEMSDEMRKELVFLLKKILNKYASMFSNFSYNLVFHEKKDDLIFRFHIEIYPRVSILAGIELGEGVYVNTLPPEVFAESYKTQASPLEVK
jgi:UDPglucose--hexose-1-phosphate uridylyltransferase